jgi:tetratricopeptide (TPR) repeat protein
MTAENQQKDTNSNDRSITRYSSPIFNRGLELAKRVSTDKISNNDDDRLFSSKSIQDAEYFFKLAVEQISPSEYQYALMNFRKALDINPDYYEVYVVRYSLIYMPLGHYQEAINDCTQALRLQPDNAELLTNRGWSYAQLGYHLQALQDYDLALMIKPDLEIAYIRRGLSYRSCSNYQKAMHDFQQAIKINPYNADAYNNKGLTLIDLGEHENALNILNKAIEINSEHIQSYLNKGLCCIYLKYEFSAVESFSRAIELNSDITKDYLMQWDDDIDQNENTLSYCVSSMLLNLGIKCQEKSNYQEAITYYTHAIILNPNFEDAYYNRGIAYAEIGSIAKAIADFNKVIEFGGENAAWAYIIRAKFFNQLGYTSEAEEDIMIGYMLLGNQLSESGNYTEAIESYTNVLEVDPNNTEAYNRRSTARSAIGDYQGAMEDLQQVTMI